MKEKDFQTRLTRWAKHTITHSCAIEAKITKTRTLLVSAVQPHQLLALRASTRSVLAFKLPDVGIMQKPFDMFVLAHSDAFLAIQFYRRAVNHFYLVPIDAWDAFVATGAKSITEKEVERIGQKYILGNR